MREAENIGDYHSGLGEITDKELLVQIRNGSQDAFSLLYKRYIKALFDYGKFLVGDKDMIEDAIHDVFVNIWSSRKNQIEIHSIKSYLFVSVRRAILRKKKDDTRREYSHEIIEKKVGEQCSIEDSLITDEKEQEKIKKIRAGINNLTDRQREIIYLRYFNNISYDEISHLLEIDKNYAYNLASKAFAYLKNNFKSTGMYSLPIYLVDLFL